MPSQGPFFASTVVNSGSGVAWTTPGNATTSNNAYALASTGNNSVTQYLKATGFSFSIPVQQQIDGIQCRCEVSYTLDGGGSPVFEQNLFLVIGGSASGNSRPNLTNWPSGTDSILISGGTNDIAAWGVTPTVTQINDNANFGFQMSAVGTGAGAVRARVDALSMTIFYSPLKQLYPFWYMTT